jgi:hypothetical protein
MNKVNKLNLFFVLFLPKNRVLCTRLQAQRISTGVLLSFQPMAENSNHPF